MKLKEIERTANVTWSPADLFPIYVAGGTAAQQLDASFNSSSRLELFRFNPEEDGLDCELVAGVDADARFNKLAWSGSGMKEGSNPSGLLAGGLENGSVGVWDPARIILEESNSLVHSLDKHTSAVSALDFNNFQTNLLASGSGDSEILLWDLNNPSTPMTPGTKSQPASDVSCLAWNCQVQHILASALSNRCIVWDLRKSEPIVKINDSMSRIKCKLVAWHPEVATQLVLASDDDHTPVIQLWDLRFASSALKVMERHERGITALSWNRRDGDFLMSAGRDGRLVCWNPNTDNVHGEVTYELSLGNTWCYEVSWSPRQPHCFSASSSDGRTSILSVMGGEMMSTHAAPSNKIMDSFGGFDDMAAPQALPKVEKTVIPQVNKAPKWLKKACGASFAFGGKLVSFTNEKTKDPARPNQATLSLHQVVTEESLVAHSHQLEVAIHNRQFVEFCSMKMANSSDAFQQQVWSFLKVNFESEPRNKYLSVLGLDSEEIKNKISALSFVKPRPSQEAANEGEAEEPASDEAVDEFEKISLQSKQVEPSQVPATASGVLSFSTDDSSDEGLLTQALLTGNFEQAVDICLASGRAADAIILANADGPTLLERTMARYFESQTGSDTAQLIKSVVSKDYTSVVKSGALESWREILALILTYSRPNELQTLCDSLGERMESCGDNFISINSVLCYICSGNIDKFVECWLKHTDNHTTPTILQELVEKVVILRKSVEQVKGQEYPISSDSALANKLGAYAELLAAQGSLQTALNYLAGTTSSDRLSVLKYRLEKALGQHPNTTPWSQAQAPVQQASRTSRQRSNPGARTSQPSSAYQPTSQPSSAYQPTSQPGSAYQPYQPTSANYPGAQINGTAIGTSSGYGSYNGSSGGAYTSITSSGQGYHSSPYSTQPASYGGQTSSSYGSQAPTSYGGQTSSSYGSQAPTSYGGQTSPSYGSQTSTSYGGQTAAPYGSQYAPTATPTQPGYGTNPAYGQSSYGGAAQGYGSQYGGATQGGYSGFGQAGQPAGQVAARGLLSKKYAAASESSSTASSSAPAASASNIYTPTDSVNATNNPYQPQAPSSPGSSYPPSSNPVVPALEETRAAPHGWNDPPAVKSRKPEPTAASKSQPLANVYNPNEHQTQYAYPGQPYSMPGVQGVPNMPYPGPAQPAQAIQQYPAPISPQQPPTPAQPKAPIPERHQVLKDTLDVLAKKCLHTSQNPQQKKKLEDVTRKLELLYDKLRGNLLSDSILNGLHQIVQAIKSYDYQTGLSLHTALVSQGNFSEISAFMPGIKMLMQTAHQLQVFV